MIINIFTPNEQRYDLFNKYISNNHEVNFCTNINEIVTGVIIIDDDYTGENPYQLCEVISKNLKYPLIMMAYQASVSNECLALEIGCLDYIKSPFSLEVLMMRLNKANKYLTNDSSKLEIAQDTFLIKSYRQVILLDEVVNLTSKQFDILLYLVNKCSKIISREELVKEVWHNHIDINTRNVDAHIKNIRKLLPTIRIETVSGVGYRFNK